MCDSNDMTTDGRRVPDASDTPVPADAPDRADATATPAQGDAPAKKSFGEVANSAVKRLLLALIGVGVLIVLYFILAAYLPRHWGERIGKLVDGSLTTGTFVGVTFGVVGTLVPIVCFAMAVATWGRLKHVIGVAFLFVGAAFAIPNLLTLAVHFGTNNAAVIGRRLLDQNAPGFQGGTLVGAIIGAVLALVVVFYIVSYKLRGRKIAAHAVPDDGK